MPTATAEFYMDSHIQVITRSLQSIHKDHYLQTMPRGPLAARNAARQT